MSDSDEGSEPSNKRISSRDLPKKASKPRKKKVESSSESEEEVKPKRKTSSRKKKVESDIEISSEEEVKLKKKSPIRKNKEENITKFRNMVKNIVYSSDSEEEAKPEDKKPKVKKTRTVQSSISKSLSVAEKKLEKLEEKIQRKNERIIRGIEEMIKSKKIRIVVVRRFIYENPENIDYSESAIKTDFSKTQIYISEGNEEQSCGICLEEKNKGQECRELSCGHSFHRECIDPWLQKNPTCPLCREKN